VCELKRFVAEGSGIDGFILSEFALVRSQIGLALILRALFLFLWFLLGARSGVFRALLAAEDVSKGSKCGR
jgi:hypothetical protein